MVRDVGIQISNHSSRKSDLGEKTVGGLLNKKPEGLALVPRLARHNHGIIIGMLAPPVAHPLIMIPALF